MALPIYLYYGPEFGLRTEAVDSVKDKLKKKLGEIDEHLFYLVETPFSQVMTVLQSGTLFSNGVCVVCKNAEMLKKKEDLEMLSQWLKTSPDQSSTLILVSDETKLDSKLEKLIPAENKQIFWEMFDDKKIPWLTNYFSKNGYELSSDGASLILDMIENNTEALKRECSRFFVCFPKGRKISVDDVESVLTHNREESAFSLFNYISDNSMNAQKRFEGGLLILQKIRLSKENSSVMIIAGLASCFRKLYLWQKLHSENSNLDSFALKINGFSGVTIQKQYSKASKIWTMGQTMAILSMLASTDMEIRSGGSMMEDLLLQKMLYEIVIKKGASFAQAEYSA